MVDQKIRLFVMQYVCIDVVTVIVLLLLKTVIAFSFLSGNAYIEVKTSRKRAFHCNLYLVATLIQHEKYKSLEKKYQKEKKKKETNGL